MVFSQKAACQLQEGPLLLAGGDLGPTAFLSKVIQGVTSSAAVC